ncbi:MAG: 16S rRNA (uracil(1498)-N(3))-methyltransferase [Rubrivivax sp.]|nr:16S rRNA (uracil(1498)-N(3))-methyltransferase [Rubrivivax sp.]
MRLFVGGTVPLAAGARFDLPPAAAAHVKVRRLQPGALLRLFDGDSGFEWPAEVLAIGRSAVRAGIAAGVSPLPAAAAELPLAATLAFAMPANERVDALVEKASELGAAALVPLMSERSVLRLEGDRAERRRAHWQGVAAAACEQCGRARVPVVHGVQPLQTWLRQLGPLSPAVPPPAPPEAAASSHGAALRCLLSTDAAAPPLPALWPRPQPPRPQAPSHQEAAVALTAWPTGVVFLSGPEGGFGAGEVQAARAAGFVAASLGTRTLRADTAPLAALAWLAVALAGAAAGRGSPGS